MPLDKGNQWTYTIQGTQVRDGMERRIPPSEMTWKVMSVTTVPSGSKAVIEVVQNGQVVDRQTWLSTSKGIYQTSVRLKPTEFSSPMPVVRFPASEGSKFSWEGTGWSPIGPARHKIEGVVLGPQEVDTDMGRQSAVPIETRTTYTDGKRQARSFATVWMTPGLGVVRYRQEVVMARSGQVILLKLKSKSLMKS